MTAAPIPSPQELIARATALVPVLKERAAEADRVRQVSAQTVAEMQEAGLFRVLQPKRFGGYEMDPQVFFKIEMILAAACPSTAWIYGVIAVHAWQLAVFDDRAQHEVWGEDTSTLISSSYMPVGKVTHVDGGYRLSGRWGFSSGSEHCKWIFVGAFVPPKEEGQRPDMRTFLVPRSDYRIEDTWFVSGLQGTGSNDIVMEDVFVPEHRTHRFSDGFMLDSPGNKVNPGPLYRIPFGQIFVRSVSSSSIGILQGALDVYLESQRARVARGDGAKVADDPSLQVAAAEAAATIHELKCVLFANMEELMDAARDGKELPVELRVSQRYDSARVVTKCLEAVSNLFSNCGGGALFEAHPIQRYFNAIRGARQHYANNPDKPGRNYGRVLMGERTTDFFI